jgi:hypothetical protein
LTLRHRVEILVDLGTGMMPFRFDQAELVRRAVQVIGREAVRIKYFADSPAYGVGPAGHDGWRPHRASDATVLLLSDLGLGGSRRWGSGKDWLRLAEQVGRAGGEVVAFIPYPRHRWPGWLLTSPIRALVWDRGTTVAHARRRP